MAMLYGTARRTCPYCCEWIAECDDYELARDIPGSPINGMTIHGRCAIQRDHANSEPPTDCTSKGKP